MISYEEYTKADEKIKTMNQAEKEQLIVKFEKDNYSDYYVERYPDREIDLELILEDYGVSSIQELVESYNKDSLDDLII